MCACEYRHHRKDGRLRADSRRGSTATFAPRFLQERLSGFGCPDTLAGPLKEPDPDLLFQWLYLSSGAVAQYEVFEPPR